MARIKRLIPAFVMAFTLAVGMIGLIIIDVSAVRAATATDESAVTETYAFSAATGEVVAVPGYPF